jgi:transposase
MHMLSKTYSSDLDPQDWHVLAPLFEKANCTIRKHSPLSILNGIFYFLHNNCLWRDLPGDLPPYQTVRYYFHKWKVDGKWTRIEWLLTAYYGRKVYAWKPKKTRVFPMNFSPVFSGLSLPPRPRTFN